MRSVFVPRSPRLRGKDFKRENLMKLRLSFYCTLSLLAATCAAAAQTMRPEVTGKVGVVAAGRHYSVAAGVRMFEKGGNAIDAGVATVFAAAVTEISHFGLGGEAPVLIYDARSQQVIAINGQGTAPKAANLALFQAKGQVDANGPLAATMPAVVDAMALALANYGTFGFAEVLAPANELADGFPMYDFLRRYLQDERKNCEPWKATMDTYYTGGRIPEVGEIFRQPNLARTLRTLVEAERSARAKGADRRAGIQAARDAFYRGDLARQIAQATREAGGVLAESDLNEYQGKIEKPYSTDYRGYRVFKVGSWNQGPVLLQTLNILEGYDLREMGYLSTEYIHTVAEAIKLAYADRDQYYADPDFAVVPMQGLLSKEYAALRRNQIDRKAASKEHRPGDPWTFEKTVARPKIGSIWRPHGSTAVDAAETGDTTSVAVADSSGNLFSSTPSSGWLLGGAFIAGQTGVPMSNRMQAFSIDPASPNVIQGGKRPRTTLTPTVVLKDGRPFLAIGTPGGDSQDQQILCALLNIFDFDMSPQQAIEMPRFNSLHMFSSFGKHENQPAVLEVEDRIAPGVLDALRQKGHILRVRPAYGISTGVVAVLYDAAHGTVRGAADVRRERYAFGW